MWASKGERTGNQPVQGGWHAGTEEAKTGPAGERLRAWLSRQPGSWGQILDYLPRDLGHLTF